MKRLFLLTTLIGFQFLMKAPYINYYFVPASKTPSTTFQGVPGNPIQTAYDWSSIISAIVMLHSGQGAAYERVHKNGTPYYGAPSQCAVNDNGVSLGKPAQISVSGITRNVCQIYP